MKDPFKPRKRKKRVTTTSQIEVQSPPAEMSHSPLSEESSTAMLDDLEPTRNQSDAIDFSPGSKLEVMDFNEKWYPVKVVEVDYEEGEVLVHFEKWSDRYDEWVPMDSNRIRQPELSNITVSKKVFSVDEKVIAVWAYNHKYPATVRQVLPNDKYEVLFSDGYAKILRGCKLFKASEEDLKNVQLPPPKKPAPPMGADPLDPDLGPKEERRLKKRRLDVLEAYLPQKKQKIDTPQSTPETSPQPSTSSFPSKEMPKVVLKVKGRLPSKNKYSLDDNDEDDDDSFIDDEEEEEDEEESIEKTKSSQSSPKKHGRKKRIKKPFDESNYVYRPKFKNDSKDDLERWNTEIPKGASPVQIINQEGHCRESIIIPDKKLPEGWTKHTLRRKKGAKWDVLLVNPNGRKFRSRTDLRNYFAELKKPFPEERFDFMVGRKMEMIKYQQENRKKMGSEGSPVQKHSKGESPKESKNASVDTPDSKRIKTMMPKTRLAEAKEGSPAPSPSTPFPLADVRNPDGGFTCCGKSFRKENLFQMHMKHYHPEYSNLFGSTPNVADLAYARTVGEPLEDSRAEAMTPKTSLVERVTKYEAELKALSDQNVTNVPTPATTTVTTTDPATPPPVAPESTPEPDGNEFEDKIDPIPSPFTPDVEEPPNIAEEKAEEQPVIKDEEKIEKDENEEPKEEEKDSPEEVVDETSEIKEETGSIEVAQVAPVVEVEKQLVPCDDKVEESSPASPVEIVPESPPTPVSSPSLPPVAVPPALPVPIVIKPVSKVSTGSSKVAVTSEAVTIQKSTEAKSSPTTTSVKAPVTITKYVPPGQKPVSSTTKMTISLPPAEKESKPTIKTLLPMRPPPAEAQESPKPKEVKPKEEVEEDPPVKSKPRKRTVSESLPKKPKLIKASTGSLEEEPEAAGKAPPLATNNTSYRFSRNRSIPRVSIPKLNLTSNKNSCVVVATPEDKIANTTDVEGSDENAANLLPSTSETDAVYENLRKEEIINCTCGYMEEDGLMIQCDLCLCWQHGLCNNIDKEADVPEKYVCYICQHPARQRPSAMYRHNQDWLKEGRLPSLSFQPKNKEDVLQQEGMLKKSHDLVSSLLQLQTVISSLRVKTHIATKPDHPKLYLWAKSWKDDSSDVKKANYEDNLNQEISGPQPEAAIDETECRLQLLDHIEDYQNQVDDRLTSIQAWIAALESEDPDLASDEASDHYPATKQTVQMVLRDLNTVRKVVALN